MNNTFFFVLSPPHPSPPPTLPTRPQKASEPSISFKISKLGHCFYVHGKAYLIRTGLAVREEFGKGKVLIKRSWVSLVVPFKDEKKIFSGIRLVSPPLFYLEGIGMGHFFSMTRITGFVRHRI